MRILRGLDGLKAAPQAAVMSVGNFDGLHRGHQEILRRAREVKMQTAGRNFVVVTFEPHPLTVLRPALAPPRLTPSSLKERLLREAGVDALVVLPPEPAVLNLTAEDFWHILRDDVRVSWLVEGTEFNFGKGRGGTIEKLKQWTAASPVKLEVIEPVEVALLDLSIVRVSSTLMRWLLGNGRVRDAAICLGRPYVLEGLIVEGYRRGQSLGVPTANLDCGQQLVPADGVYAGRSTLNGATYPAAISIGTMPTFGQNQRQVEVHLVGFSGDIYGRTIQVEMLDWLRDQRKFSGVEELKRQLARDIDAAVGREDMDPATPVARL
jgi:riboflavin kinase / FMN adenylyltransferase